MLKLLSLLVPLAETVFRGPTAKARAGSATGVILMSGPLLQAFSKGFVGGAGGSVEEFGYALGSVVVGGVLGWIMSWLPANKVRK